MNCSVCNNEATHVYEQTFSKGSKITNGLCDQHTLELERSETWNHTLKEVPKLTA